MPKPRVDRVALETLIRDGVKYEEIATRLQCSYSTVAHAAKNLGLGRAQFSHKEAIPWTLSDRHKRSAAAQNFRELSRIYQGDTVAEPWRRATAIKWAQFLVSEGLDVDYDPDAPPSELFPDGGFFAVDVGDKSPLETHIGHQLDKAMKADQERRGSQQS